MNNWNYNEYKEYSRLLRIRYNLSVDSLLSSEEQIKLNSLEDKYKPIDNTKLMFELIDSLAAENAELKKLVNDCLGKISCAENCNSNQSGLKKCSCGVEKFYKQTKSKLAALGMGE